MVLPRPVTMPVETLLSVVREEKLGEPHITIAPTAVWRPKDARREEQVRARQEITRLGWLDRRGQVDAEVAASLAVLCRAAVECYGWIKDGARTIAVLAGAIGREAVLAVRDGDSVSLSQLQPDADLAAVLVAQLPDLRPARGRPVTVDKADLVAAPDGRVRSDSGMSRPASVEVRQVQQIAALPTIGGGELYVATREGVGRYRKGIQPLRYADTEHGRFLNATMAASNGVTRIVVGPATKRDLVGHLHELRRSLIV